MTDTTLKTLYEHWNSLREGRLPPFRSEISPRALPEQLDTLFILEMLNPKDVRIRIAGIKICEMIGMEVRGQSPMSFFEENARGRFASVITDVLNGAAIARLSLKTEDKLGNIGNVEMILLPLRSDFGDVSRIIGCVTVPTDGFTAPIRYHIDSVKLEPLSRNRNDGVVQHAGFAEERAGFIMDDAPAFRTISGNADIRQKRPVQKQNFLKVVS